MVDHQQVDQLPPPRPVRRNIALTFHCKICDAWTSDQLGYPHQVCGSCHPIYEQRLEAERRARQIENEVRILLIRRALTGLIILPLIDIACDYAKIP